MKPRNLASSAERLRWLQDFVRPIELVPILLESQEEVIAFYGLDHLMSNCGQRSLVSNVRDEIVGTICSCPDGKAQNGVGCSMNRKRCHIAKRWDKRVAKMEGRTYTEVANEMTPEWQWRERKSRVA